MEPIVHSQITPGSAESPLPDIECGFTFHFAAEYFDRGWSVLPLCGKRPAVASWREYQTRRASLDELRTWFSRDNANVGVVTGAMSGLVVVDCDTPDDARFWQKRFPQTPLAVATGRGGSHYYYRYPHGHDVFRRAMRHGPRPSHALHPRGLDWLPTPRTRLTHRKVL